MVHGISNSVYPSLLGLILTIAASSAWANCPHPASIKYDPTSHRLVAKTKDGVLWYSQNYYFSKPSKLIFGAASGYACPGWEPCHPPGALQYAACEYFSPSKIQLRHVVMQAHPHQGFVFSNDQGFPWYCWAASNTRYFYVCKCFHAPHVKACSFSKI